MDELDPPIEIIEGVTRPSVKELVARLQQAGTSKSTAADNSESSDDEDNPLRVKQHRGPMGDSNLSPTPLPMPNYENITSDAPPRSRSGVYSPTLVNPALVDSNTRYVEPVVKPQDAGVKYSEGYVRFNAQSPIQQRYDPSFRTTNQYYDTGGYEANPRVMELNSRFAKLRMLDNGKVYEQKSPLEGTSRMLDANRMFDGTVHILDPPQDTADRDTNNDSGYSTKVYGSSKGNSPSLSGGQVDGECMGAASLV